MTYTVEVRFTTSGGRRSRTTITVRAGSEAAARHKAANHVRGVDAVVTKAKVLA